MSGIDLVFQEFYETSTIKNAITDKNRKFDTYNIYEYCLEKDIDLKKEKSRLFDLCLKHGVSWGDN